MKTKQVFPIICVCTLAGFYYLYFRNPLHAVLYFAVVMVFMVTYMNALIEHLGDLRYEVEEDKLRGGRLLELGCDIEAYNQTFSKGTLIFFGKGFSYTCLEDDNEGKRFKWDRDPYEITGFIKYDRVEYAKIVGDELLIGLDKCYGFAEIRVEAKHLRLLQARRKFHEMGIGAGFRG